jgi:hypothetical protein
MIYWSNCQSKIFYLIHKQLKSSLILIFETVLGVALR